MANRSGSVQRRPITIREIALGYDMAEEKLSVDEYLKALMFSGVITPSERETVYLLTRKKPGSVYSLREISFSRRCGIDKVWKERGFVVHLLMKTADVSEDEAVDILGIRHGAAFSEIRRLEREDKHDSLTKLKLWLDRDSSEAIIDGAGNRWTSKKLYSTLNMAARRRDSPIFCRSVYGVVGNTAHYIHNGRGHVDQFPGQPWYRFIKIGFRHDTADKDAIPERRNEEMESHP